MNCQLSDITNQPDQVDLNKLLPCALANMGNLVTSIQVNTFKCGGIAIGVCISHKVADALSMFMFINSWAATSRAKGDMVIPHFGLAKTFPPRELSGFKPSTGIVKDKILTKRFVFSSSKVASLRENYTNDPAEPRTTRVEAVSGVIWSRFMAATQKKSRVRKTQHSSSCSESKNNNGPSIAKVLFW